MREWAIVAVLAACSHEKGGMGERCNDNKVCNAGLYCDVDTCIAALVDAAQRDAFEPGDAPTDGRHDPFPDAPMLGDAPLFDAPTSCVNRVVPAPQAHTHAAGATTHAGEACIVAGCHLPNNAGTGAPGFDAAGTIYTTGGFLPNTGATIRLTDAVNKTVQLTSDSAGNFYLQAGVFHPTFPEIAGATVCPTSILMTGLLQSAADGNCNRAACHSANGSAGAGPIDL